VKNQNGERAMNRKQYTLLVILALVAGFGGGVFPANSIQVSLRLRKDFIKLKKIFNDLFYHPSQLAWPDPNSADTVKSARKTETHKGRAIADPAFFFGYIYLRLTHHVHRNCHGTSNPSNWLRRCKVSLSSPSLGVREPVRPAVLF
jgi:hypothetical protein